MAKRTSSKTWRSSRRVETSQSAPATILTIISRGRSDTAKKWTNLFRIAASLVFALGGAGDGTRAGAADEDMAAFSRAWSAGRTIFRNIVEAWSLRFFGFVGGGGGASMKMVLCSSLCLAASLAFSRSLPVIFSPISRSTVNFPVTFA